MTFENDKTYKKPVEKKNTVERKITIVYKSGHVSTFIAQEFESEHLGGNLKRLTWEPSTGRKPLFIGIADIESIWEE